MSTAVSSEWIMPVMIQKLLHGYIAPNAAPRVKQLEVRQANHHTRSLLSRPFAPPKLVTDAVEEVSVVALEPDEEGELLRAESWRQVGEE